MTFEFIIILRTILDLRTADFLKFSSSSLEQVGIANQAAEAVTAFIRIVKNFSLLKWLRVEIF